MSIPEIILRTCRLLVKGDTYETGHRVFTEELPTSFPRLRLVVGVRRGASQLTPVRTSADKQTTGKPGPRRGRIDETTLPMVSYGDQALRSGNYTNALNLYRQAVSSNLASVVMPICVSLRYWSKMPFLYRRCHRIYDANGEAPKPEVA